MMESPSRHGLSTILGLITAALSTLPVVIGQLSGATEPLGVNPTVWVTATVVITCMVILSKAAQAVVAIFNQDTMVMVDAPEPDLNIPDYGDPIIPDTPPATP